MRDLAEIEKLPISERFALVSAIWNSILEQVDASPLSRELRDELDHELAEHRRQPETSRPWEDVDRELFGDE